MNLELLKPLYDGFAPVASVYLDTTRAEEDADKEIELRWRGLRDDLAARGADAATLDALDGVIGGARGVPGPQGEAAFAAEGRVLAAHTLARPPARDHASWLPVADPLELVADYADALPHVVVALDRVGADVSAYPAHGGPVEERSFNGATLHVQKVQAGGWSQKRYQRGTEKVWSENAAQAADDVESAVDRVSAAAVFVGGDERAIGELRRHLSERTAGLLVELPTGGRADYAATAALRDAVESGLREIAASARADILSEFAGELERGGPAVQGLAATTAAMRQRQVGRLLLATNRAGGLGADRSAGPDTSGRQGEPDLWAAAHDPMMIATEREELPDPRDAVPAPASVLLIRAAYAADAELTTLPDPGAADEGTGALLRFTLSSASG